MDLGLPMHKSRLVIHANIVPDKPITMRVSASRRPGTPTISIDSALVSLFEGDDLVEQLTFVPSKEVGRSGIYTTRRFLPKAGHEYTIHVAAAGYDPATAVSSIPAPVAIEELRITDMISSTDGDRVVYEYDLLIDYDDPSDQTDFYDLRIWQRVIPIVINGKDTTSMPSRAFLRPVSSRDRPLLDDQSTLSILQKDEPAGSDGKLTVSLRSELLKDREELAGVFVELRTVSPEYYYYRLSIEAEMLEPIDGLSEPVILYDNVDSGIGIFAGYNTASMEIDFFSY